MALKPSKMIREKVLLISFAPNHSSAINRVHDCSDASFELEVYQTDTDKVNESIFSRIFSLKYPLLILNLLRSDARVFWAWGLDACLVATLACLIKPRTLLLWDISDINVHLVKPGWKAKVLRFFERILLRRADGLLLTSPSFYSEYYAQWIEPQQVKIIENLLRGTPSPIVPPAIRTMPVVVVYSGIIRSLKIVKLMSAVARIMGDEVVFHIHGYPDRMIGEDALRTLIAGEPNIHYHGKFASSALQTIYADAHLIWGFVDPDASTNERWLLTNRIYNGVAFGRPVLTNADTTSGKIVSERHAGLACSIEPQAIADAIRHLMADDAAAYGQLQEKMPAPSSAYLDGHYARALSAVLAKGRRR